MSSSRGICRILVADDEPALRRLIGEVLKSEGHYVDLCENGRQALDLVATSKYSLLILDVMMPEKTGFDVIREIREQGLAVPVILVTSSVYEDALRFAEGFEGVTVLSKPFSIASLRAMVEAAVPERSREGV
jgi:DNA-binding response OmpR family regulator